MVSEIDRTLGAILTRARRPSTLAPATFEQIRQHAHTNRVGELLADAIAADADVAASEARRAAVILRESAVTAMLREQAVRHLVRACAASGVRMLLIKGAGLAHTVYPGPHLRPSLDIDAWVAPDEFARAESALRDAQFQRMVEPDSESASTQRHYVHTDTHGKEWFVDLHLKIANRHAFANALAFDNAWSASQPVPRLDAAARTLGLADALFLACIHRVAHHDDEPHLIWLWDIHLLAGVMTGDDAGLLIDHACRNDMRAVVSRGLGLSRDCFGTAPFAALASLDHTGGKEASSIFIGGRRRPVDDVLNDLASVSTTRGRLRLIREHLFPDAAYMRAKYPACPPSLLPAAYVYRILRGAPKWWRRAS